MINAPTTTPTTIHNDIASTYGPLALSALAIIVIALAAFSHGIDWTLAIGVISGIVGLNGFSGATRWQAAPALLADIQTFFSQQSQPATTEPTTTPTTPDASPPQASVL